MDRGDSRALPRENTLNHGRSDMALFSCNQACGIHGYISLTPYSQPIVGIFSPLESILCILVRIKDIHLAMVLSWVYGSWRPHGEAFNAQSVYWLYNRRPDSAEEKFELMFDFAGYVQCNWVVSYYVHSKIIDLCSLPDY